MTAAPVLLLCLLLLLAAAGAFAGRWPAPFGIAIARLVHGGCAAVSAGFALLAILALATGGMAPVLLPFGPPWAPLSLGLDALSAWFLLLLGLAGLAAGLFALEREVAVPPRRLLPWPLFLAGMALTLLAADAFTLLLGFELMSLASWALVASSPADAEARAAARQYLGFALFAAACLVPAVGLMGGLAGDLSFAGLRAAPPQGWAAVAVLALVLAGAGAKAGLVPLHGWLPLAHPVAPGPVSALLSGVMTKVALYVMARLLLDLGGLGQPLWWGVPLMVMGAASAVLGALRAGQERDTKVLLACSTIEHVGLVTLGLGLAATLRAADLGPLAALAAAAALLHALAHGLFKTLLFLVAAEVQHAAGSRRLDSLGALVHAMPAVALCALVGAAAAAALPPLSGFAGEWLLLQALLGAWRVGELGFQVLVAACTALAALAAALGAAAMLRFWGLAFLGRPRGPRTLGAQDAPPLVRAALAGLAGLAVLIGLLPGPLLMLGAGAIGALSGHPGLPEAAPLSVSPSVQGADYAPLPLAVLLGLLGAGLVWLCRRLSPQPARRGPAWDGGFQAPPPHLPFGDPATQPGADGFAQPLRRMLGGRLLAAHEAVHRPPPGDTAPARLESGFHDPLPGRLLAPLVALRERLSVAAERLRDLSLRRLLMLGFGTLVLLLLLLALLPGGGAR
ncbi:proton-conducting transporter transmembrane domain-containing protein [Teichococcus aestuarii]|uniref:Hydrogenase 4 subunit B n=1 Tax=Teichococcus aestuarii TaxID=568898 RepID=A0A2U1V772_9PROT|nr:proton-conducting transporter membrane subunit [Pseudoroseomonas aestuarii]PWC29750.1 hydrogenase 4 subunit B [Pseudoroseomonas aestuarii]